MKSSIFSDYKQTRMNRLSVFKDGHKIDSICLILKKSAVPTRFSILLVAFRLSYIKDDLCKVSMW